MIRIIAISRTSDLRIYTVGYLNVNHSDPRYSVFHVFFGHRLVRFNGSGVASAISAGPGRQPSFG